MSESRSILIVDDHPAAIRLFVRFMELTPYRDMEVLSAETVDDAADHLSERSVDAVFLDNRLPPYDGFAEPFRRLSALSDAPFVLITGSDLEDLGYTDVPEEFAAFLSKNDFGLEAIQSCLSGLFSSDQ